MLGDLTENDFTEKFKGTNTGKGLYEAFGEIKKYKHYVKRDTEEALKHWCKAFLIEQRVVIAKEAPGYCCASINQRM